MLQAYLCLQGSNYRLYMGNRFLEKSQYMLQTGSSQPHMQGIDCKYCFLDWKKIGLEDRLGMSRHLSVRRCLVDTKSVLHLHCMFLQHMHTVICSKS